MTSGSIWRSLLGFSIPIMISNLVQSTYNAVDMLFVGRFTGTESLAAVSVCGPILNVMIIIIKVISHELGIILDDDAQLFGTGDEIPDLLAGLAQGHRLQAGLPLLCADNGKNIENREHQNDDHYSGYIEFHQRTKEPGQLFFHTHHLQL